MKKILLPVLLITLFLNGCKPKEDIPMYKPDLKLYRGSAIVGNGEVCLVYSDDERVFEPSLPVTGGILQFYFRDFTASYVRGSSFNIKTNNRPVELQYDSIGIEPFFSPFLNASSDTIYVNSRIFVTEKGLVGQKITVRAEEQTDGLLLWNVHTPGIIPGTRTIRIRSTDILEDAVFIRYDNGITLAFATYGERSKYAFDNEIVAISTPFTLPPGGERSFTFFFAAGESDNDAIMKLFTAEQGDLYELAYTYWNEWISKATTAEFPDELYTHSFRNNLYAVRASSLKGAIPADLTGQYITNGLPQLYPRDAMMTARMFIKAGYPELAAEVLRFWLHPAIQKKSPGEWYARYDAYGKPVDAGTGSRFDVPEWDASAYTVLLQEKLNEYNIEAATVDELYDALDFLAGHIDTLGLLYEGGIIELVGYLPSTNMTAAAALESGATIAQRNDDPERARIYASAAQKIRDGLPLLFDADRQTYIDLRPGNSAGDRLWNTSANFGILWGFPDHTEISASNRYYLEHCMKLDGGMQYFDTRDPELARYGHDCFIFTTGAAAQYQTLYGEKSEGIKMIHWMIDHANSYGLMPERIMLPGNDCSQASPLTWSSAEFINAMLIGARNGSFR
jgi:hypothetical protein